MNSEQVWQRITTLAHDPRYLRPEATAVPTKAMETLLVESEGSTLLHRESLIGFWRFAAELLGEAWKPIVSAEGLAMDFEWWLDRIEFNATMAVDSEYTLQYRSGASLVFTVALVPVGDIPPQRRLHWIARRYLRRAANGMLEEATIRELASRFIELTSRFLQTWDLLESDSAEPLEAREAMLLSVIAKCYVAVHHLRACAVGAWLELQVR